MVSEERYQLHSPDSIEGQDRIPEFREVYINEDEISVALSVRHYNEVELSLFDAKNIQFSLNSDNSNGLKSEDKTGQVQHFTFWSQQRTEDSTARSPILLEQTKVWSNEYYS